MTSEPMLQVTNVTKKFGNLVAVHDVSFEVHQGEILALIGPNGAGKTTLFNVISGLLKPDAGEIRFKGVDITRLPGHKVCALGLSRTFQVVRAFAHMTVSDAVRVGAYNRCSERDVQARTDDVLEICDLTGIRDKLCGDLTLAPLRRVELARAMATGAELLMLDEAGAGLTATELTGLIAMLRQLNADTGITLIVVEHVMQMVMGLCGRILVLDAGELISQGTPAEVSKDQRVLEAYLGKRGLQ